MTVHLDGSDIDVWLVPATGTRDRPNGPARATTLSAAEQDRARNVPDRTRSREWTHFQETFRSVLARYVAVPPEAIELGHRPCGTCQSNDHGAPLVGQDPGLQVSVSRTRGMACIAVARRAVGVDIERIRSVHPSLVSRDLLSEGEIAEITTSGDPDETFLQKWVAAEATLKASQSSLVGGLSRHAATDRGLSADNFVSVRLDAPAGFAAAVAYAPGDGTRILCRTWSSRGAQPVATVPRWTRRAGPAALSLATSR